MTTGFPAQEGDVVDASGNAQPDPAFYTDGPFWIYVNPGLRHTSQVYIDQGYADYWDVDLSFMDGGILVNLNVPMSFPTGSGWIRYYNYDGDLVDDAGTRMYHLVTLRIPGTGPQLLADLSYGAVGSRNVTYNGNDGGGNNYYGLTAVGMTHLLEIIFEPWWDVINGTRPPPRPISLVSDAVRPVDPPAARTGLNVYVDDPAWPVRGWVLIGPPTVADPQGDLFQNGPLGPLKITTSGTFDLASTWIEDQYAFHSASYFNDGDFPSAMSKPLKVWDGVQWVLCTYMRQPISGN